jgi:tRNA (guanine37-N1)-methyltransferase
LDEYPLGRRLIEILSESLPSQELANICGSYDIVGDIAIMRLTEKSRKYRREIAEATMGAHLNVKTSLAQTGPVHGDFRVRRLEFVAGENKTVTTHVEYGCILSVDVKKCYFSPRLSYERMRVARQVGDGEVVVNMFAGVGSFSLLIAKHSGVSKVYSIDVNAAAVQFMRENTRINGAYGKVIPILGDSKRIIEEKLCHVADRVLMPLPEKALEYLPYTVLALKEAGGWIHYYDFEHATRDEDPVEKIKLKVAKEFQRERVKFEVPFGRVIRSTGPNWYQVVLDVAVSN